MRRKAVDIIADIYKTYSKVVGGMFTRYGGNGWTRFRFLLPGSRFDYERDAGDLWMNPVVGLCLDWLGNRFPRPLLHVSKIKRNGDFAPVGRHPLVDLWNRPNEHYGRRTMEKAIGLSLKVDGNAYIYKVRDNGGRIAELWWIPHYRCLPTWPSDGSKYIDGYRVWLDSAVYILPPEDIIHIRDGIDPRNERLGLCALRSNVREVCTINEESGYRAAILRNSGVPGLVVIPDEDKLRPTQSDADAIRDKLWETTGGDNRGQTAVLGGRYKIEVLGFSPEQLNLVEFPVIPTARILSSMGVAPMSVGLPDPGKTYANLAEANRSSWGSIVATQELVAEALRWCLLPEFGNDPNEFTCEYDYTHIQELQEALDAVHARTREDWKAGLVTLNEAREVIGFEPNDDGDRWFPGTGSPEEQAVQDQQHQERLAVLKSRPGLPAPGKNGKAEEDDAETALNGDGEEKRWSEDEDRFPFADRSKGWATRHGQHIYMGPGGAVMPHGPGAKPVAHVGHGGGGGGGGSNGSSKPASAEHAAPASSGHKEFSSPGKKVAPEQEHEMMNWQKEKFGKFHESLSKDEKAGVDKYLGNSHEGMNGMLRDPARAQSYEALHPGSKKAVEGASKALNKASMPETVTAYRGVRDAGAAFGGNLKVGAVAHDPGFMSMSQDHRVASGFLKGDNGKGALIKITVPKGSKVAGVSVNEKSVKTSEHEMLSAPGHGLKITKIEKKGGKTIVHAELVPPVAGKARKVA